jgi:hypothetical protein
MTMKSPADPTQTFADALTALRDSRLSLLHQLRYVDQHHFDAPADLTPEAALWQAWEDGYDLALAALEDRLVAARIAQSSPLSPDEQVAAFSALLTDLARRVQDLRKQSESGSSQTG